MDRFNRILIERRFCALADPDREAAQATRGRAAALGVLACIAGWFALLCLALMIAR